MGQWIWIVLAGIIIRAVLLPAQGFPTDVSAFASWMHAMVEVGPRGIYLDQTNLHFPAVDYPPGYLYVLWFMGLLERLIFGTHPSLFIDRLFVKLPAVCSDFAVAFGVGAITADLFGERAGLRSFAVLLLAPMLWFISADWGQVDVVAAMMLVFALRAALRSRYLAMWILLALAISIKPQPFVTIPFFFLYQAFRQRNIPALIIGPAASIVTAYLVALPASPSARPDLCLTWLFERYTFGVAKYPNGSSGAFNLYTVFGNAYQPDTLRIFGVPLHTLGTLATIGIVGAAALFFAFRLRRIARETPTRDSYAAAAVLLIGTMTIAIVGLFLGMTRMHERYEMAALVLLPIIAAVNRQGLILANIFWIDFCINAACILVGFYGGHHHPQILILVHAVSLANIFAFAALVAMIVRLPIPTTARQN